MGVESTGVSIKIEVTDSNSAAVVGSVTKNMQELGTAGANTGRQVAQGMATGAAGIRTMSAEMAAMQARQQAIINQLNAWKPQDNSPLGMFNAQVTAFSKQGMNGLAAQEAAIASVTKTLREQEEAAAANAAATKTMSGAYGEARIAMGALTGNTRQMEMGLANLGSRMKWMAPLWAGAMDATIAVAGVAVVVQMGEAVYDLYEKWLDTDAAIDKYNEKAAEAASKKFDESRSIEQLNNDLRTTNELIDQLNQRRTASKSEPLMDATAMRLSTGGQFMDLRDPQQYFGMKNAEQLNEAQGKNDESSLNLVEKRHQAALNDLRDKAMVSEAGLTAIEKARVARKAAHDEADEQISSDIATQKILAAMSERAGRKPGDKDYVPEPDQHDFDDERKAAYAKADATYKAAQIEDARQTQSEIRRIHEQALEADLQGIQLLEQQRKYADAEYVFAHGQNADAILDIDHTKYAEEKKLLDQQATERAKQEQETLQKATQDSEAFLESLDQFASRVDRMREESAMRGLSGFARIHADAQRQIDDARSEAPAGSPDLARYEAGIRSDEARDSAALQQKNADETTQIENQARAKFLSAERQQTQAIETEYRERLEKFKEEMDAEISTGKITSNELASVWNDYNRRVIAAAQIRDAELVDSARKAREQMAGEFTSLFSGLDHPLKELQRMGDKIAGEAAAALAQRAQNDYDKKHGGSGASGSGFDINNPFGGFFDKLAGKPAGYGEKPPQAVPGMHSIAVSQAAIQVGSASISLGGGMPGGATGGGAGASGAAGVSVGGGSYTGGGTSSGAAPGAVAVSSGGTGASVWGAAGASNAAAGSWGSSASTSGTAGAAPLSTTAGMGGPGGAQAIAPPASHELQSAVNDVSGGIALGKQAASVFGGGGGGGNAGAGGNFDVNQMAVPAGPDAVLAEAKAAPDAHASLDTTDADSSGAAGTGMLNGGGFGANAMGAVGGAIGLYSAYEGNGGVGGALSGAMSGMQLGMALGGPIGAGIGAAAGAVLGAIGMGGRERARVYDLKQVRPQMASELQSYKTGGTDYLTAYSDMQTLDTTAERTTKQWGPAAHDYYNDTIRTEIAQTRGKLDQMEKAGRANFGESPAEAAGGWDSVPRDGMAVIHARERIIPGDQNERITRAIESGSRATQRPMQQPGGWGGDVHIHALDAASASQWIMNNKHTFRAAINASYAENSGGADAGF